MTINSSRTTVMNSGQSVIYYDKTLNVGRDPDLGPAGWFDPLNPDLQAELVQAGGRAAAWFIQIAEQACVLRHYRRGGMAARFFRDQYLWTGATLSRSIAEFSMMQSMWLAGLPVPQPLAAAVWRKGLVYRAALITAKVQDATPLAHVVDSAAWAQAGRAIAKMHQAEIWHADLNVFNVLMDPQGQAWLIDFDRARAGYLNAWQRAENLARLLRSVRKVCPELEQACWPSLTSAYALEEQDLLRIGRD